MLLNFEDSLRDEHILLLALVYFCHRANLCILLGQLHRQNNLETLQTKYTASIGSNSALIKPADRWIHRSR